MHKAIAACLLTTLAAQNPAKPPIGRMELAQRIVAMHRAIAACLLTTLAAQNPAEPSLELKELAQRIDQAHRPKGPVPPVTSLRTDLTLRLHDPAAEQRGQVDLAVQFMVWSQAGKKDRPLLRYEVCDAGKPIVRGRDRFGYWQLYQGKPVDLNTTELAADLENCQRHTSLAQQLLRFLAPGEVLRALQQPSAVKDDKLAIERNKPPVECSTVSGTLPSFPLLQKGGDDAPVQLQIYVAKDKGTLLAVDATPIVDGKPDPKKMERTLLGNLHECDGLLVPHELRHLFRDANGQLRLQSTAVLVTVSLRPELRVEDFDRER